MYAQTTQHSSLMLEREIAVTREAFHRLLIVLASLGDKREAATAFFFSLFGASAAEVMQGAPGATQRAICGVGTQVPLRAAADQAEVAVATLIEALLSDDVGEDAATDFLWRIQGAIHLALVNARVAKRSRTILERSRF